GKNTAIRGTQLSDSANLFRRGNHSSVRVFPLADFKKQKFYARQGDQKPIDVLRSGFIFAKDAFEAGNGICVTVGKAESIRSLQQNALLWKILSCFSQQKTWIVNGEQKKLSPEDWKDVLSASFMGECRMCPNIAGTSMVILGVRTSKMRKEKMNEFIEFLQATAIELDVMVPKVGEK
ncbi:MAG: recombination protein NinB, partial [Pseudomonadota bacterium]